MTSSLMGPNASQPELACTACQTTQETSAQTLLTLERVKEVMGNENAALAEELAGARATLRTLERQLGAAKAMNEEERIAARESDPKARTIKHIYETWVVDTGHKRSKLTKERWDLIKTQLANHPAEDLVRAIKGAALLPYVRYGKRFAFGAKDEIATQLEHCIGPKPAGRVEMNVDYYRRACSAAAEQRQGMWETWQRVSAQEQAWADLVMLPLALVERGVAADPADVEAFLWERVAESDREWDEILAMPSNVVPIRSEAA